MTLLTSFTKLLPNRGFLKAEIFSVPIPELHNLQPFLSSEVSEMYYYNIANSRDQGP